MHASKGGKLSTDFYAGEDVPRLLHSVIFIGKNLVHIFAAKGKIYMSIDLKSGRQSD